MLGGSQCRQRARPHCTHRWHMPETTLTLKAGGLPLAARVPVNLEAVNDGYGHRNLESARCFCTMIYTSEATYS